MSYHISLQHPSGMNLTWPPRGACDNACAAGPTVNAIFRDVARCRAICPYLMGVAANLRDIRHPQRCRKRDSDPLTCCECAYWSCFRAGNDRRAFALPVAIAAFTTAETVVATRQTPGCNMSTEPPAGSVLMLRHYRRYIDPPL